MGVLQWRPARLAAVRRGGYNPAMQHDSATPSLLFPFLEPPRPGEVIEAAPGLLWLRLPLPYRLNHVNLYLLADDGGWAVVDTGLGTDTCRAGWDAVLAGPLAGQRLTRMIVTHYHPDHVGLAGWFTERFALPLAMPRPEYLFGLALQYAPGDLGADMHRPFYRRHGLAPEHTELLLSRGHEYLRRTTGVPTSYHRIKHGDALTLGGRGFDVLTGGGHALEQAMLCCAGEKLFLAADQVIAKISPNVSVHAMEPDLDALGIYLDSLADLRAAIAPDVLVLPGHGLPFYGLHARIAELIAHHADRCALIAAACRERPRSVVEIIPFVFHRELDEHQMGFAFGEVLAHVNHMLGRGELALETDRAGIDRYRAAPA